MNSYNLYGSEGCHLCEQAHVICLSVLEKSQLNEVDIIVQERVEHENNTLVELYGIHIPVLEKLTQSGESKGKLFWPFTAAQVKQLSL